MVGPNRFRELLVALAFVAAAAAPIAVAAPRSVELTKALEELRESSEEWRREEAAFRTARTAGKLSRSEFGDHAGFVAGLHLRVLQQCEAARRLGGEEAIKGFDCISLARNQSARLVVIPSTNVQTEKEKQQSLNARLNALEAEIDESLLKRQQEIRQKARSRRSSSAGASGGGGAGGSSGASARSGARGPEGSEASSGGRAKGSNTSAEKGKADQANGVPPTASGPTAKEKDRRAAKREVSIESGSDDDIIARQLREAAEKETDPILKKKLWEEYRKYKRLQQ